MKANTVPKDISPNEAKLKAAIRIMVTVALRILEKDKQSDLNLALLSHLPVPPSQGQDRDSPNQRKAGIL